MLFTKEAFFPNFCLVRWPETSPMRYTSSDSKSLRHSFGPGLTPFREFSRMSPMSL